MTEKEYQRYTEIKERFRRLGIENPADVILALDKEVEDYRSKIQQIEKDLKSLQCRRYGIRRR